jgi:hypothetical protein
MQRCVEPEILDRLPARDPAAIRSRSDLRRLNGLMGHSGILARALAPGRDQPQLCTLVELGGGDGTLLLQLAKQLARNGHQPATQLVDQLNIVSPDTHRAFAALGWPLEVVTADVFDWLASSDRPRSDGLIANLFLHHFSAEQLRELFRLAAERTNVLVACEPRRSPLALHAARLLSLIGCNAVTRHDAVVSVRAGFTARELSTLWPAQENWQLTEKPAGLFSHCFIARRLQL